MPHAQAIHRGSCIDVAGRESGSPAARLEACHEGPAPDEASLVVSHRVDRRHEVLPSGAPLHHQPADHEECVGLRRWQRLDVAETLETHGPGHPAAVNEPGGL